MPSLSSPLPYFGKAPQTYSQMYLDSVVQSFSIFLQQNSNPGDLVISTLKIVELPVYENNSEAVSGGLSVDTVYRNANGDLKIVV